MTGKLRIAALISCLIVSVLLITSCKYLPFGKDEPTDSTTESHVHAFSPWVITKYPLEGEAGTQTRTCASCGEKEETAVFLATGLSYEINADGVTCSVTGIGSCTDSHIYVPFKIDGYRVSRISDLAFLDCNTIESIAFSEGLECIDDGAFLNCKILTGVNLPGSLTTIGSAAFSNCTSLASIVIPAKVSAIAERTFWNCSSLNSITFPKNLVSIGHYAFRNCVSLKDISIPSTVTVMGSYVFSGCESLTSVTVPNAVSSMGTHVFRNCTKLTSVHLGSAVANIGEAVFAGCVELSEITVDQQNPVFYSAGNCLIDRASNVLIAGCKNSVIPQNVEAIGAWAFFNCKTLQTIDIPEGVSHIGFGAFSGCDNLQSVKIPQSVLRVEEAAFENCDKVIQKEDGMFYVDKWIVNSDRNLVFVNPRENTVGIADNALAYCRYLEAVTITSNLVNIGKEVFINSGDIESITVAPNNPAYYSENNCLIEKASMTLVLGCKNSVIPKDIRYIGESAFRNCSYPSYPPIKIVIPDGVLGIGDFAYWGCGPIREVTLPASLECIGENVFELSHNSCIVAFKGTVEQWATIEKRDSWRGYTIHCEDGSWTEAQESVYAIDDIPLYKKATDSGTVLCVIPKEAKLHCLQENSDWCYVEYNGMRGYVSVTSITNVDIFGTDFLHFLTPLTMYACVDNVTAYRYPTSASFSPSVGSYKFNEKVVVLGTNGGWALVQYDQNNTCYVYFKELWHTQLESLQDRWLYEDFWGYVYTMRIAEDEVNLYKDPDEQSDVHFVLSKDDEVTILKSGSIRNTRWHYVVVENPNDPTTCVSGYILQN